MVAAPGLSQLPSASFAAMAAAAAGLNPALMSSQFTPGSVTPNKNEWEIEMLHFNMLICDY